MATLTDADIAALTIQARMGYTLEQAIDVFPKALNGRSVRRIMKAKGVTFRRPKQRSRPGQWAAQAARDSMPDEMDAAQSNRERARLRHRVVVMGMSIDEAINAPLMSAREKGLLGARKRWGTSEVVDDSNQANRRTK